MELLTGQRVIVLGVLLGVCVLGGTVLLLHSFLSPQRGATVLPHEAPVALEKFSGVVPHIFFHSLIIYPEKAATARKSKIELYKNYFITVAQFKQILAQLGFVE